MARGLRSTDATPKEHHCPNLRLIWLFLYWKDRGSPSRSLGLLLVWMQHCSFQPWAAPPSLPANPMADHPWSLELRLYGDIPKASLWCSTWAEKPLQQQHCTDTQCTWLYWHQSGFKTALLAPQKDLSCHIPSPNKVSTSLRHHFQAFPISSVKQHLHTYSSSVRQRGF